MVVSFRGSQARQSSGAGPAIRRRNVAHRNFWQMAYAYLKVFRNHFGLGRGGLRREADCFRLVCHADERLWNVEWRSNKPRAVLRYMANGNIRGGVSRCKNHLLLHCPSSKHHPLLAVLDASLNECRRVYLAIAKAYVRKSSRSRSK